MFSNLNLFKNDKPKSECEIALSSRVGQEKHHKMGVKALAMQLTPKQFKSISVSSISKY